MSRYIDAEWLKELYKPYESYNGKELAVPIGAILANIEDAPSIDIEPKRGEWQYVYKGKWMFRRCSCCEWTQTYDDSKYIGYRYNFCPNCGVDMREREGE